MKHWLLKTEPRVFSWQDLKACPEQTAEWDGVRNYQARNLMKEMEVGDRVFIYHSVVKPQVITGIAHVVRSAYPDFTAFDAESPYYDPKSDPKQPRWFMVDVRAITDVVPPISRDELKQTPELQDMMLLKTGCRLSVQPVSREEWQAVCRLRELDER